LKESNSRILKAINPDIIGLQEINNHSSEQTAELIEEFLPSSINEQWFSSKQGSDIVVISRYPISQSFYVEGNGAFLIDLSKNYEQDLLLINAHPPCCAKNDERQKEIDAFMAFIRDAKEEGGALTLKENTPIVILGDMNLVGYNQQQKTLITGDIVNTNDYGDKFIPDWDTTSLMDTKPPTTHSPSTFTWYNKRSDFAPGRLDYIVYTNSVIEHQNGFVLFTNELPQDSLDKYNLLYDDATRASDHLPVVADFNFGPIVSVNQVDNEKPNNFVLLQNYPNPFNPSTTIKYKIPSVERDLSRSNKSELKFALQNVSLKIYDILGREVAILVNKQQLPGNYEVKFDGRNLASGVYYYQLKTDSFIQSRKMILMK
ncbi:MAG: endonuclease/exonuclease/phosphatase family protein, partial [Bacteroidota bacterium]